MKQLRKVSPLNAAIRLLPLLAALVMYSARASGAEYDARYFLGVYGGWNTLDSDRHAHDDTLAGTGIGRYFGKNWSLDFEFESYNSHFDREYLDSIGKGGWAGELRVKQYHFAGRYYFTDKRIRFYVLATAGLERIRSSEGDDEDPVVALGVGLRWDFSQWGAFRLQASRRHAFNDWMIAGESGFQDTSYRLDLMLAFPWQKR